MIIMYMWMYSSYKGLVQKFETAETVVEEQ